MKRKMLIKGSNAIALTLILAAVLVQLPPAARAAQADGAAQIELTDGTYAIDVTLGGGSGRSTVSSPAVMLVRDGHAYARIEWSSPNYDYMRVGNETYLPIQEGDNSAFEIPIAIFDEPMQVIGDTTAMSTPHEVEYTLTFATDSIISRDQPAKSAVWGVALAVSVVVGLSAARFFATKKRGGTGA